MSKKKEKIDKINIITLGNSSVGKSSLIQRYVDEIFADTMATIGFNSKYKTKILSNGQKLKVCFYDTSGQEKYNSITKLFVKGSQIVLLVYSIDNLKSFENIKFWFNFIKNELTRDEYVLAIIGNKKDLFENEVVDEEQGKKLADDLEANFSLISAKYDRQGIDKLFDQLLDEYISTIGKRNQPKRESVKIKKEVDKKNCC